MEATLPLDRMTVSEKLRAMEDIWDDLCRMDDAIPSPDWHGEVLRAREKRIQAGGAKFVDLDEAKSSVRSQVQ